MILKDLKVGFRWVLFRVVFKWFLGWFLGGFGVVFFFLEEGGELWERRGVREEVSG